MIDSASPDDVDLTPDLPADTVPDPFDRVAEEFLERCRRGESPSVGEYEGRFPDHAQRIRELLPSVAMMEQLKRTDPLDAAIGVRVVGVDAGTAGRVSTDP